MKALRNLTFAFISTVFLVSTMNAQVIVVDQSFSSDTIIKPFTGSVPVYSLCFSGSVDLLSDSSLIRVILIDTNGNHFMVFESYPLITHKNAFDTINSSDETTFLNGIACDSLRIDIINAIIDVSSLKLDTNYISNTLELQEQAKWEHDSVKIDIMNQGIVDEHMYWRAGRTSKVLSSFQQKETLFGEKYNLLGFDYYKGGIYEKANRRVHTPASSTIVSSFDWRNRHGANDENSPYYDGDEHDKEYRSGWVTEVKEQGEVCGACYAFTAIGATEAYLNLYYNVYKVDGQQKHYDINLSEQQIISCDILNNGCTSGQYATALNYLSQNYVVEESCFPYQQEYDPNVVSCNICSNSNIKKVKISGHSAISHFDEEIVKENLILHGPFSSGYDFPPSVSHAMVLVGYGISIAPSLVYKGNGPEDPDIYIEEGSPIDGNVNWIFKNSFGYETLSGTHDPYYITVAGPVTDIGQGEIITGDLSLENISFTSQCNDEDGDGFYWWGTSQTTPCSFCEQGINQLEDCDDNNPNVGPYNLNPSKGTKYECSPICDFQVNKYEEVRSVNGVTSPWDSPRHFNRNVIVRSGAQLTISAKITFSSLTKLVIEPGASVTLEGQGILTTASDYCTGLWRGVELWGYANQPPDAQYQGKIIIENGGTIENAWFGIRNFNPGYNPDGSGSYPPVEIGYPTGGIIQANGAIFRNNKFAVKFYPYRQYNIPGYTNSCYFYNCEFITDNELEGNQYPDCFIRMDGVKAIKIKDCLFENSRLTNESPFGNRGKGIFCFNSDLEIPNNSDSTYFKSLDYGIYALNGAALPSIVIKECSFHNNRKGISINGFTAGKVEIRDNIFWLNNMQMAPGDSIFMIYLEYSYGFKVWLNKLIVNHDIYSNYPDLQSYGIVVNESEGEPSFIFNNGAFVEDGVVKTRPIHHFKVALEGRNRNRTGALTGLCYKCNDMENNTFDIVSYSDDENNPNQGIAVYQGIQYDPYGNYNSNSDPAGNTFSDYTGQNYLGNINNDISASSISYIYHHNNPASVKIEPDQVNPPPSVNVIQYNYQFSTYNKAACCSQSVYPEGSREELRSEIIYSENKIDSIEQLLSQFIDAGSTDTLHDEVATSLTTQSYEVYQDLLAASPYLSDTVLKKSIEREDVLPNAMIRDIMVANPQSAKDDSILTVLDNRVNPMPDSLYVQILAGTGILGAKELLENKLSFWKQKRQMNFRALMHLFQTDTANSWAQDSLVVLLESEPNLSSKYSLLCNYIDDYQFGKADTLILNIPSSFMLSPSEIITFHRYDSLLALLKLIYIDSLGYRIPDSTHLPLLQGLAVNQSDLPGVYARNILVSFGLMEYEEPYIIQPSLKSTRRIRNVSKTNPESPLKVFPNPCSDYVTVEYLSPEPSTGKVIAIYSSEGKLIVTRRIERAYNQFVIPMTNEKPGIYLVEIKAGNKSIATKKLVVIK